MKPRHLTDIGSLIQTAKMQSVTANSPTYGIMWCPEYCLELISHFAHYWGQLSAQKSAHLLEIIHIWNLGCLSPRRRAGTLIWTLRIRVPWVRPIPDLGWYYWWHSIYVLLSSGVMTSSPIGIVSGPPLASIWLSPPILLYRRILHISKNL